MRPARIELATFGFVVRCPEGHSPIDHRVLSAHNTTRRSLHAVFNGDLCRACTMLDRCPVRATNHRKKGCEARHTVGNFRLEITLWIRPRDDMYALQKTPEWKGRYKIRAGIEATNSELKRAQGIGRLRVRRWVKVYFTVACKVIACNIKRLAKAHLSLERILRGSMSALWAAVTLILFSLIGVILFRRRIVMAGRV